MKQKKYLITPNSIFGAKVANFNRYIMTGKINPYQLKSCGIKKLIYFHQKVFFSKSCQLQMMN